MMNIEDVREYCLSLPAVTEDLPFDEETLCLRVDNHIFAMLSLDSTHNNVALKCNPDMAVALREQYKAVTPGYHMNKRYWNDVYLDSDMDDAILKRCICHSYNEVVRKLPKYKQKELLLAAETELSADDVRKV